MKFEVIVVPNAHQEKVLYTEEGTLKIWVGVVPEKGAANERAMTLLAKHFDVSKNSVRLVRGSKSRTKIFEIT